MRIQAQARARSWATEGSLQIKDATGSCSDIINGRFVVAERPNNKPPIYRRADGSDCWLYVDEDGMWGIGSTEHKLFRKTSPWAFSIKVAEGKLPHEVGTAWKVSNTEHGSSVWTEQQLKVISEVCVPI